MWSEEEVKKEEQERIVKKKKREGEEREKRKRKKKKGEPAEKELWRRKKNKSSATNFSTILPQFCFMVTYEWWNYGSRILFPLLTSRCIAKSWQNCEKVCDTRPTQKRKEERDQKKKKTKTKQLPAYKNHYVMKRK